MINELKKSLDDWFGDNGNDDQELDFIQGWCDCYIGLDVSADHRAGAEARNKYEQSDD